jgi:hypothetical protein
MYDLGNPVDLFTLLPQEMEIAEVKAMSGNLDGVAKKKIVMEIVLNIAKENNVDINEDLLNVFIDTIDAASKGKYALNKKKVL